MMRWLLILGMAVLAPASQATAQDDDAAKWMERGIAREQRKDYVGAMEAYSKVLRMDSKRADAYLRRGLTRSAFGAGAFAVDDLNRAIELDPDNGLYHAVRADIRSTHTVGNRDDALADYSKAIGLKVNADLNQFSRSSFHRLKGELEAALADANKSLGKGTKEEPYRRFWRGLIHMRMENFDDAVDDFSNHLANHPAPQDVALAHRAYCYLRLANKVDANKDFAEYLKRQKANAKAAQRAVEQYRTLAGLLGADKQPETAAEFLKRALQISGLGLDEWAVDDANRAIALDPKSATAHYDRSVYRSKLYFYTSELADLDKAIKLSPKNESYYAWRANCCNALNKRDEAIADARRALAIDDRLGLAYNQLANAYSAKRQWPEANAASEKAVQCAPVDPLAWEWRHLALKNIGKLDESIAALDQAIKLDPKYANNYIQRGEVYAALGQSAKADADFSAALEINPNLGWPHAARGKMKLEQGNAKAAVADLDRALQISRAYPFAYYYRGLAKEKAGDPTAEQDRDMAVWLDTDFVKKDQDTNAWVKFAKKAPEVKVDPLPKDKNPPEKDPDPPVKVKISAAARKLADQAKAAADKGDWETAAATYTRALAVAPRFAEAYLQRGLARLHLKQDDAAKEDFATALRIDPSLRATLDAARAKIDSSKKKQP